MLCGVRDRHLSCPTATDPRVITKGMTSRFAPAPPRRPFNGNSSRAFPEFLSNRLQTADRLSHQSRNHLHDIGMHGAAVIVRIKQDFIQTTRHCLHVLESLSLGFDRPGRE